RFAERQLLAHVHRLNPIFRHTAKGAESGSIGLIYNRAAARGRQQTFEIFTPKATNPSSADVSHIVLEANSLDEIRPKANVGMLAQTNRSKAHSACITRSPATEIIGLAQSQN